MMSKTVLGGKDTHYKGQKRKEPSEAVWGYNG